MNKYINVYYETSQQKAFVNQRAQENNHCYYETTFFLYG